MGQAFEATTAGITVTVQSFYLADRSNPDGGQFLWAYRIHIANRGGIAVQLLARSWRITDAAGRLQIVQGDGVVGAQPILAPGDSFEYTSGTPLQTASGFMAGQYHMIEVDSRAAFDISIPTFSLESPHQNTQIH